MYPYLFPYTFLLSIFVRLCFGHIDCAIILSNLFSITVEFLLYKILHKMKGKKNAVFGMIISGKSVFNNSMLVFIKFNCSKLPFIISDNYLYKYYS